MRTSRLWQSFLLLFLLLVLNVASASAEEQSIAADVTRGRRRRHHLGRQPDRGHQVHRDQHARGPIRNSASSRADALPPT